MKEVSKKLLKNLLNNIDGSENEDISLAIKLYCFHNEVDEYEFVNKVNDMRKRIFNRTWSAYSKPSIYETIEMEIEDLIK